MKAFTLPILWPMPSLSPPFFLIIRPVNFAKGQGQVPLPPSILPPNIHCLLCGSHICLLPSFLHFRAPARVIFHWPKLKEGNGGLLGPESTNHKFGQRQNIRRRRLVPNIFPKMGDDPGRGHWPIWPPIKRPMDLVKENWLLLRKIGV
jgi:hypothetical protein